MKRRQNILPCGRVYFFTEMGPRDLALKKRIKTTLMREKEEFNKFSSYEHAGRKRSVWCKNTYNKFVSLLTDHLMNSDRLETKPGRYWAIGSRGESPKHMNWHSDGKTFGVAIQGIPGQYRILLSRKRGKELQKRIVGGQKFHSHE